VHSCSEQTFSLCVFFEEGCFFMHCHGLVVLLHQFFFFVLLLTVSGEHAPIVAAQSAIGLMILPW